MHRVIVYNAVKIFKEVEDLCPTQARLPTPTFDINKMPGFFINLEMA